MDQLARGMHAEAGIVGTRHMGQMWGGLGYEEVTVWANAEIVQGGSFKLAERILAIQRSQTSSQGVGFPFKLEL